MKLLKNACFQLIAIFLLVFLFGEHIPPEVKALAYSLSLTLKWTLMFFLPFVIFTCLFNSMLAYQEKAVGMLVVLVIGVFFSNLLSTLAAYQIGVWGYQCVDLAFHTQSLNAKELVPYWNAAAWVPPLFSNGKALLAGVLFGLLSSWLQWPWRKSFGEKLQRLFIAGFLEKGFLPLLPLFALGFILKMEYEGILGQALKLYAPILLIIALGNLVYITLWLGVSAKFRFHRWVEIIKNFLPASLVGLSTMSSLAAMPFSLKAAEKSLDDPRMAKALIPSTLSIHMIGDSIALPLLAIGTLLMFGQQMPNFHQYLLFTLQFMAVKFTVPAVPSGSILVVLPLYKNYFPGFNDDMAALVIAVYILFDSMVTAFNIMGNGGLAIILEKVFKKLQQKKGATPDVMPA